MKKMGFTGTRKGMTLEQWSMVDKLSQLYDEVHHGDCLGADYQMHLIAQGNEQRIIGHPPSDPKHRAWATGFTEMREEKPYLDRNKDIVDETDTLIVVPAEFEEQLRSGTWSTWRYAVKQGKDYVIVFPDGSTSVPIA